MADFDFAAQPGVDAKLINDLASLRFLGDAANVLFVGPPGVGKTMLAVALARGAVEAGHRPTNQSSTFRQAQSCLYGRWSSGQGLTECINPAVDSTVGQGAVRGVCVEHVGRAREQV